MTGRAERNEPIQVEVGASLGALDDVADLERAPAGALGRRPA